MGKDVQYLATKPQSHKQTKPQREFTFKIRLHTPKPGFFRLIPYTPVPPTTIDASGFRRLRPTIYEQLTCLIDRILIYLRPHERA
jgi:hypothetical protein